MNRDKEIKLFRESLGFNNMTGRIVSGKVFSLDTILEAYAQYRITEIFVEVDKIKFQSPDAQDFWEETETIFKKHLKND